MYIRVENGLVSVGKALRPRFRSFELGASTRYYPVDSDTFYGFLRQFFEEQDLQMGRLS